MVSALAAVLGLLVGVVIGGLGGGGGVLTVPALVFLLGQSAHDATTSSVVIVGVTALVGVLTRLRGDTVDWRTGLAFGAVGVPAAYLGTRLNQAVSQPVLLLVFACLTVLTATVMLLDRRPPPPEAGSGGAVLVRTRAAAFVAKAVSYGGVVGVLTGFLGVGGGFLVVPALVIALRVPVRVAIGTSLLIITINSTASLATRLGDLHLDWAVVAVFTAAAIAGSVVGGRVAARLDAPRLTTAFAVLLLLVGTGVGVQSAFAI